MSVNVNNPLCGACNVACPVINGKCSHCGVYSGGMARVISHIPSGHYEMYAKASWNPPPPREPSPFDIK